jgi:hypothetical protein
MKRAQIYKAEDGETFDTAEKCQMHERKKLVANLCSLTEDDIEAALRRDADAVSLAAYLERAGNIIAAKRRADGDMRKRKALATADEKLAACGGNLLKASK